MKKVFTLLIALLLATAGSWAQITQLLPLPGRTGITVTGINDNGMVVGYCKTTAGVYTSFKWTQADGMVIIGTNNQYARAVNNNGIIVGDNGTTGAYTSIYWPPNSTTAMPITATGTNSGGGAWGINDNNKIVGRTGSQNPTRTQQGYVWDYNTNTLTLIGTAAAEAKDINNSNEVVGHQRFRWISPGPLTTIAGVAGDTWGQAFSINNSGVVVGFLGNTTGGFMQSTSGGPVTALGTLAPYAKSYPVSINDNNQIVGDFDYGQAAFIYENGTMTNLSNYINIPGWVFNYATGINNNGWIIGTGTYNGVNSAFVFAPPPPEPITTIETSSSAACGTLKVDVKVSDFTDVGAISLKLNYNDALLSYTDVTLNSAIASGTQVGENNGLINLAYFGNAVTLNDGDVLFTLHFDILATTAGNSTTDLTWNTSSPGFCEFAGPGGTPVYASVFTNLTGIVIPERPVKNVDTGREYCTIQAAIDADETDNGDVIEVSEGTYIENVLVDKSLTFQGNNIGKPGDDARIAESTIDGYVKITAGDVSFDGFKLLNGGAVPAGENAAVHIVGGLSNFTFQNNVIVKTNGTAPASGDTYRGIINEFGGITNITVTDNMFKGWATGLFLQHASLASVNNNLFDENFVGMSNDYPNGVTITNNEFSDNGFEAIGIGGTLTNSDISIQYNKISGNTTGVSNYSTTWIDATLNWWGDATGPYNDPYNTCGLGDDVSDYVTFSPWWTDETGTAATATLPVENVTKGTFYCNIQDAVKDANATGGNDIRVSAGTYFEAGQILIDKNMTITGADKLTVIVKPNHSTSGGSYSTTSGWWLVEEGISFGLSDVTLDGTDLSDNQQTIETAIQSRGELTVERCIIRNIKSAQYLGRGIVTLAGSNNLINEVSMSNIQRIGIHVRGHIEPTNPVTTIKNFTYVGKGGVGDFIDYGVEFGGGGQGVVGELGVAGSGAHITNCLGVASTDGSVSAGILITDYYGTETIAEVYNSELTNNSNGIVVGYGSPDISKLTARKNKIYGNTDYGISALENTDVDAVENWWGDITGPYNDPKNLCGLGNDVSDYVDFYKWYADAAMTTLYSVTPPAEVGGPAATSASVSCIVNAGAPALPVFEDHCGTELSPSGPVITTTGTGCLGEKEYEYTFTDQFGQSVIWTFTYNVNDNVAPVITIADITISCDESTDPSVTGQATAVDCNDVVLPLTYTNVQTAGVCANSYTITRTWTAVDECGNTSTEDQIITVQDVTPPTITCPPAITVKMNDGCEYDPTIGAGIGVATATDNCTAEGDFAINNDIVGNLVEGPNNVVWTAVDECGNSIFCTQVVTVVRNTLSGTLMYNNTAQTPMGNVTLLLSNGNSLETSVLSGIVGDYTFTGLCAGTYTIEVTNNNKEVGYINATDAGAANAWGTVGGAIEYVQFLAGDVNDNLLINSTDAQAIQNYFVLGGSFTKPWEYWSAGSTITSNYIPYSTAGDHPAAIEVVVSGGDVIHDLYAQATGDFNGSFTPDELKSASRSLLLTQERNLNVDKNQEFELPLRAGFAMEVGAVSMILDMPEDVVQVTDVQIAGSEVPVTWAMKGSELRIGWNSLNPVYVGENDALVVLKLQTSANFTEGELMDFDLVYNPLNELADGNFEVIKNAKLKVAKVGNGLVGINQELDIDQLSFSNYPNPFNRSTTLAYAIPVDGKVNISIYNQLGQLITSVVDLNQRAGHYTIENCGSNLVPGMYIAKLRLTNEDTHLTGMIKLNVVK